MRYVILVFFILTTHLVYSQTAIGSNEGKQVLLDLRDNYATYIGLKPKSDGTIGTPFLFDDFRLASVKMINNYIHKNVKVNFFVENGEVFVELNPNHVVILDNSLVESITILDSQTVFIPFTISKKRIYVQILLKSNDDLYVVYPEKQFVKATVGGAYNTGEKFDEYKNLNSYYHVKKDLVNQINVSSSGYKYLAGKNWKVLRDFVKENNLDLYISNHMLRVIEFSKSL